MTRLTLLFFLMCSLGGSFAQEDSLAILDLNFEFRPRFEFRDGYRTLPSSSTSPAFFVSQRSRLSLAYEHARASFHFSFQDVRIWGQNGNSPATGGLGLFESYATFDLCDHSSIKLGRQAVELDNGRLFSKANWNQFSRTHDGISLRYKKKKIHSQLFFFYNQNKSAFFGTNYTPPTSFYKYMAVHYLTWKIRPKLSINLLNVADAFQSQNNPKVVYARGTSGGGVFYAGKKWAATFRGYYQYGQTRTQESLNAFYLQPEVAYTTTKKHQFRLGAEYLSGSTQNGASFNILYGVAFKFNGNLNYFTDFQQDLNGKGLIDPYFSMDFRINKSFRIKTQLHVFYTAQSLSTLPGTTGSSYLGVENDLKIKYSFNDELALDAGLSLMIASEQMEVIKSGDSDQIPVFSFLMLTWKPNLLHWEKPLKN